MKNNPHHGGVIVYVTYQFALSRLIFVVPAVRLDLYGSCERKPSQHAPVLFFCSFSVDNLLVDFAVFANLN